MEDSHSDFADGNAAVMYGSCYSRTSTLNARTGIQYAQHVEGAHIMIAAGTGHRPDKLGGYGAVTAGLTVQLACEFIEEYAPDVVISGMAIGWDQALAVACNRMDTEWWAYVPFHGQESKWPPKSQALYNTLLSQAHNVVYVEPHFSMAAFQKRNVLMVDHCDFLVALWNGSTGGTANCIEYAQKKKREMVNLWSRYEDLFSRTQVSSNLH